MSFHTLLDPYLIIKTVGLIGVVLIIFAESGLFFGFFLPGDSLMFTAGLLASKDMLSLGLLLILCFVAAALGDNVGYAFGKKTGSMIFTRNDSWFFHKKHVERAKMFYEKYGKKTIVFARFIPIIRTFVPIIAGVAEMEYQTFLFYNLIGAFVWTWVTILLGYLLGNLIPNAEKYLGYLVIFIIIISFVPAISEYLKYKRRNKKI